MTVFPYRNVLLGECIQEGEHTFNDQIIISSRENIVLLDQLYDRLEEYLGYGVPFNPETLIFYHFHVRHGLQIDNSNKWIYELLRDDSPLIWTESVKKELEKLSVPEKEQTEMPAAPEKGAVTIFARCRMRAMSWLRGLSPRRRRARELEKLLKKMEETNRILKRLEASQKKMLSKIR